jgi:glutamyl-tRNA synthetase
VPTYHFANIVDDHLMEISHVTRGEEWLPSFPKNILLYKAFGWTPPKFIHLPLILNRTGGKLSKRQGDVFAEQYRAKGYLSEAIVNFCALLGWHAKNDQEIYSLEELKKVFSLTGMGTSPAIFDLEKLDYFNGYYIRQKSWEELTELCEPYLEEAGRKIKDREKIKNFVSLARERMKKLEDVKELTAFLFSLPPYEKELLIWKNLTLVAVNDNLREMAHRLQTIPGKNWQAAELEKNILNWLKENNKKTGDYLWPLRVALTGLKASPGPFAVAWALGKEESLIRIEKALK